MNRAEKFKKIFDGRQEIVEKVKTKIGMLRELGGVLRSCSTLLKTIADHLKDAPDKDERKSKVLRLQGELDRNFTPKILTLRQEMSVLQGRLGRPTLNVGITGSAGIGKSTLLQQLTGVSNDIIPARDPKQPKGGSYTGAPSIIINNLENDNVYADIEFYQEADFFEDIIKPYYQALDKTQEWLLCPASFGDFRDTPLPPFPEKYDKDNLKRNLYDALNFRQENATLYQQDFGRILSRQEDTNVIRRYVVQKDKNNKLTSDWIPVKMVTIYCPFWGSDGERNRDPFSVCDTPGLGDIACKAEDSLLHNVAENIDAVWMMNLVTSNSQIVKQADSDLYMLISQALPEWQPSEWVYGVVNRFAGTTPEQVKAFCDELQKRHINFRKTYELDARDRNEVWNAFEATLDDIVENQYVLDQSLFKMRMEKVRLLLENIRRFATDELKPFLREYDCGMLDFNVARVRFEDEVWNKLRNSLTDLNDEYRSVSQKNNEALEQCVRELAVKKDDPDFLVKPVKVIAEEIKSDPAGWFKDEMDRLRVALGKEIGKMVTNLASLFDELRCRVRDVFLNAGQLNAILKESDQAFGFIDNLSERMRGVVTPKKDVQEDIIRGLSALRNATLSYEQLLEPRITQYGCLDVLNPNGEGKIITNLFDPNKSKEENKNAEKDEDKYPGARYAREILQGQIQEALEKVCKRINERYEVDGIPRCILVEPSAALYSTVEKFYLVMFADKASYRCWEEFYVYYRDEIWVSDQQRIPQSLVRQWNNCIDNLFPLLDGKSIGVI